MKAVLATALRWAIIAAVRLGIPLVLLATVGGWWGMVIIISVVTIVYLTVWTLDRLRREDCRR